MKIKNLLIVAMALVLMTGCANTEDLSNCLTNDPCGFWYGVWHGSIIAFSFICSLFCDDVAIYAAYNNGPLYNLGFILGVGVGKKLIKAVTLATIEVIKDKE